MRMVNVGRLLKAGRLVKTRRMVKTGRLEWKVPENRRDKRHPERQPEK
jgi:hypothetical protein